MKYMVSLDNFSHEISYYDNQSTKSVPVALTFTNI